MPERVFTVPDTRPEPEREEPAYIATPLGYTPVVVDFSGKEPWPPQFILRGRAEFNRVDYRWEATFVGAQSGRGVTTQRWELRRDGDWTKRDKPVTSAGYDAFKAHLPALAEVVTAWAEDNVERIHQSWIDSLEWGAHYLESQLNRDADELESKLVELEQVKQKLDQAKGNLKLEVEKRSRPSALAV